MHVAFIEVKIVFFRAHAETHFILSNQNALLMGQTRLISPAQNPLMWENPEL